ncbi:MAG TPA: OsmC family protein [Acidisarcina sp.]
MAKVHKYAIHMEWKGNDGEGTKNYQSYRRDFTISSVGKQTIEGSSDPSFRGDRTRYNPEEMLVASLSSCHMLWYLHLCSANGIIVLAYEDIGSGRMEEASDGTGAFSEVTLRPAVRIASDAKDPKAVLERAVALHSEAHHYCYIAQSVRFPVIVAPQVTFEAVEANDPEASR